MLDGIRKNSQSLLVKVAFAVIIVVFVFWGIGAYSGPKGIVASVNGKNITETEFQRAFAQQEESVRRSMPDITSEQMQKLNLEQKVLQSLVQEKTIESEAERINLTVSLYELRALLNRLPYFQKDGKFDPDLYREVLANNHLTPAQFEKDQAKAMLPSKLFRFASSGAMVTEADAKNLFDFIAERRSIDYILIPFDKYLKESAPSDAEIKKYYDEKKSTFTIPPTVSVEYLKLDPSLIGDPSLLTDEDLKSAYEKRISQYTEQEKIRARHILVRVKPGASDADWKKAEEKINALLARIKKGEDFATVAAAGEDGTAAKGGDLGWFTAPQMVPEFSKAAFALKPGEVSAPVKTQFGYHLIKQEEHKAALVKSFADVKESLRKELATEKAAGGLEEKADEFLAQVLGGKSMKDAAQTVKLSQLEPVLKKDLSAEDVKKELNLRDSDVQTVMTTSAGTVLDTPIPAGTSLLVIKVLESKPETIKQLETVKSSIIAVLTEENAKSKAVAEAKKLRETFKADKPADTSLVKSSKPFGRNGLSEDITPVEVATFTNAVFSAAKVTDAWLQQPFKVDKGAALVRVASISAPEDKEWNEQKQSIISTLQSQRANIVFQNYMEQLYSDANVKIFSSRLLQKNR